MVKCGVIHGGIKSNSKGWKDGGDFVATCKMKVADGL